MTDAQLTVLLGALASFGAGLYAAMKWGFGRVVKAIDDSSAVTRDMVHAFGRVEASLELLTRGATSRAPTAPLDDPDEPRPTRRTPVHGVRLPTRGFPDDTR